MELSEIFSHSGLGKEIEKFDKEEEGTFRREERGEKGRGGSDQGNTPARSTLTVTLLLNWLWVLQVAYVLLQMSYS